MTGTLIQEKQNMFENTNNKYFDETVIDSRPDYDAEDDAIKYYLAEISKHKLLSVKDEKRLSKLILKGDKRALNKLINSNLRLVVKIAKSYVSREYPLIDIIQDGNMGLISAAKKFNYKKGVRFATYASLWIKQMIQRNLYVRRRTIKLPYRKEIKARQMQKYLAVFYQEQDRYPTIGEISDYLGVSREDIENMLVATNSIVSLEEEKNEKGNFIVKNLIKDENYLPEKSVINNNLKEEIEREMSTLNLREQNVLKYRFGLEAEKPKTLKEIGKNFGLTPEAVRQIERKALLKLNKRFQHAKVYLNN